MTTKTDKTKAADASEAPQGTGKPILDALLNASESFAEPQQENPRINWSKVTHVQPAQAQGEHDCAEKLAEACRLAQQVIGGSDTSGSGQRQAHSALFVALAAYEKARQS